MKVDVPVFAEPDTARAETPAESEQRCDVCAHPAADHDRISGRYCAATLANALTRNCICR